MGLWSRDGQELLMGEIRLSIILNVLNSCKYSRIVRNHLVQAFSHQRKYKQFFPFHYVGFSKCMKEIHFLLDNVSVQNRPYWPEKGSQKDLP